MKKVCTKCDVEKLLEDFPKNSTRKDGHASWCKVCNSNWKKDNKEHISDYNKAYIENNKEYVAELKKKNYDENRDSILLKHKKKREENLEEYRARDKKRDDARKDARVVYSKKWAQRPETKVVRVNAQNKRRAKYKETDITTEWLTELRVLTVHCPTCNCEMIEDGLAQNGKTLDHIITLNTFGTHTMDNVRYICRKCNNSRPKDNSDVEESFITEFKFRHNVEEEQKITLKKE